VAAAITSRGSLYIVQGHDHPWLLAPRLNADDMSWVSGQPPVPGLGAQGGLAAKTRYRQEDAPCAVTAVDDHGLSLAFAQDQWAVTPGQSVVLYQGEVCLGGAVIAGTGTPA
jgi:tRNA-specific 2-thiouridylase